MGLVTSLYLPFFFPFTQIIFDSDWNPQNDLQAQSRCHRIGQKREVKVYRILTRKTYEREMFERASKKLGLEQAVLGNLRGSDLSESKKPNLQVDEIDALLKHGAYDVFRDVRQPTPIYCSLSFSLIDVHVSLSLSH